MSLLRQGFEGQGVSYAEFLNAKKVIDVPTGIENTESINPALFGFQRDITAWALRRGRAAVFADCGLGKTPMQLEWAKHIPGRVLIVAPLAVAQQTVREGEKFDVPVVYLRSDDGESRIVVTNYEMLEHFDPKRFVGIVLDESSILKSYTGKFRTYVIEKWGQVPFRLAATATPAPNDYMELGNHAEFLGVMSRTEMLSMFFVHDGGDTQQWRLKGHAESEFWRWICSWAVNLRKPSDLGYEDEGFILPPLHIQSVVVESKGSAEGTLFAMEAATLQERIAARRESVDERALACAKLVNGSAETWIIWCNLNSEGDALRRLIPAAVEVRGSDSIEVKEQRLRDFSEGRIRVIVTKPSIAGFGLNWQHCANMAFVGLSDSYEQFYQAVRRCWRFGQTQPVTAHIVTADVEGAVVRNIERKEHDAQRMADEMVRHMSDLNSAEVRGTHRMKSSYAPKSAFGVPKFLSATL